MVSGLKSDLAMTTSQCPADGQFSCTTEIVYFSQIGTRFLSSLNYQFSKYQEIIVSSMCYNKYVPGHVHKYVEKLYPVWCLRKPRNRCIFFSEVIVRSTKLAALKNERLCQALNRQMTEGSKSEQSLENRHFY